jgi:addiction module RelE/StbE family toxin
VASIRWTVGARKDLRSVIEYIALDSPVYAAATADRILRAVEQLRRQPRSGRIVPEIEIPSVRELIVGNYRVVYQVKGRIIGIIALVHGHRDMLTRLRKADWNLR